MPNKPKAVDGKKCTAKHPNLKGLKCCVISKHDLHSGTAKDLPGSPMVEWKLRPDGHLDFSRRVEEAKKPE